MEIHWQASISNPEFPVLGYLVRVEEQDEPNWRKNCTRFQTKGSSEMCVVNELRSGKVYIVQIAARNVVGYSPFTKTEAQTKNEPGNSRFHKEKMMFHCTPRCKVPLIAWCINYDLHNSAMFGI